MKRALPLLLLFCALGAQAELYKWVGPDGKVTYSDVPPPNSAKQVEKKALAGAAGGGPELPFELAEAARNHPVTLYTSAQCAPCDEGRKLLNARGIPFAEKTITTHEDLQKLLQAGGDKQLPTLFIGRGKHPGFNAGEWNTALTASGYPTSSKLPGGYQNPPAEPAAPQVAKAEAPKQEAPAASQAPTRVRRAAPPPPQPDAPPGFRF